MQSELFMLKTSAYLGCRRVYGKRDYAVAHENVGDRHRPKVSPTKRS